MKSWEQEYREKMQQVNADDGFNDSVDAGVEFIKKLCLEIGNQSYERGKYMVMNQFVNMVEMCKDNPKMNRNIEDINEDLINTYLKLFKKELKQLHWVEVEKEELDKILHRNKLE
jgi:hypothetical protein